jgi:hypothetical protein
MKKLLSLLVLIGAVAFAQDIPIVGGSVQKRDLSGTLASQIESMSKQAGQPFWIAWSEPMIEGEHHACCFQSIPGLDANRCIGGCKLEKMSENFVGDRMGLNHRLEAPGRIAVFVRVAEGKIADIRPLSNDCAAEASGKTVYWLNNVPEQQSVAWLTAQSESDRDHNRALDAIALHRSPEAEAVLERFAKSGSSGKQQEMATFWLGSTRGRRGYEVVREILQTSSDERIRKHAVFAMSESKVPEATDELIKLAKTDRDSAIRGESLFWLAQKAGKKAAGAIKNAIENDPNTDVKKKAVFALSQMNDEGVTKLIEVAQQNRNPEIRREAVFWLGQSEDPRALDFIESILRK